MKMMQMILLCILLCVYVSAQPEGEKTARGYTSAGMTAYSRGEYEKAIDNFKQAASMRPENSSIVYNTACCYTLLGNNEEIIRAIEWIE
jgi:tetratricopeptide (TPR) repeat protein